MAGYIALAWHDEFGRHEGEQFATNLRHRHHLVAALETDRLIVLVHRQQQYLAIGKAGVIIGEVFTRDDNAAPVDAISPGIVERAKRTSGASLLTDLWGDYLAFLDQPDQPIALLRDPGGGIACYTSPWGRLRTFFSSAQLAFETGLLAPVVDWIGVSQHLAHGTFHTSRTCLSEVREVLPGTHCRVAEGGLTHDTAWNPWRFADPKAQIRDRGVAVELMRAELLRTARALSHADGPTLLELSGGLDSSLVGLSLHHAGRSVECLTLVTLDPGADERRYAQLLADAIGAPLHAAALLPPEDDPTLPGRSLSARPAGHILSRIADELFEHYGRALDVKGYFGGGGGDYVLCYLGTSAPAADALRAHGPGRTFRQAVVDLAALYRCTIWKAGRLALVKAWRGVHPSPASPSRFLSRAAIATEPDLHPWFPPPDGAWPGKVEQIIAIAAGYENLDARGRAVHAPTRQPLTAQPMIELCLTIPSWMSIAGGRNRAVARDAFGHDLPKEILNRRTKGDFSGFNADVFGRNRALLLKTLEGGELDGHGLLDLDAIRSYLAPDRPMMEAGFAEILKLASAEHWVRALGDAGQPHQLREDAPSAVASLR